MQPVSLPSTLARRLLPLLLGLSVFIGGSAFLACDYVPARERTATDSLNIENLRAFARLYGYVRYFHPSDAASAIDWDKFAVYSVRQVRQATSREDLKRTLEALFRPIAPTVQLYATGETPPTPAPVLVPDDTAGLKLVAWQHRGVGLGDPRSGYRSIRLHRTDTLKTGPVFGSFGQVVDAALYRGYEMKLQAAVKAAAEGRDGAKLWLTVVRPGHRRGFYDNVSDRPVTTSDWKTYAITGHVGEGAERIIVGGILGGEGTTWFDDFKLFVRESAEDEWTPVPLENAGFEKGAAGAPRWAGEQEHRSTSFQPR